MKKNKVFTIILIVAVLIISIVAILSTVNISHIMKISAPDQIVVYNNSASDNVVFDKSAHNYNKIYNAITDGFKQKMIKAIFDGQLFKDIKIVASESQLVNLKGITISFVYNTPQILKYKNSEYLHNDTNYWYQALVFKINTSKGFINNTIAIIPPNTSSDYVYDFTYTMHYEGYSNLNKAHTIALNLFN